MDAVESHLDVFELGAVHGGRLLVIIAGRHLVIAVGRLLYGRRDVGPDLLG